MLAKATKSVTIHSKIVSCQLGLKCRSMWKKPLLNKKNNELDCSLQIHPGTKAAKLKVYGHNSLAKY